MSVTAISDSTNETRYYNRSIELENAAPILLERNYSHGGKEFLPDYAGTRWNHGEDIKLIRVAGYVLKKDRTAGQQRTTIDYITPAHNRWGTNSDFYQPAPAWLLELFGIETTD